MARFNQTRIAVLVLAAALVLRLSFSMWWQYAYLPAGVRFAFPDSESYWELGQRLAKGEPYQFGSPDRKVFRAPGYPLLLASMFRVLGDDMPPIAARIMGGVLGTLSVAAVLSLAQLLFGPRTGLVAAALIAVYPEAVAASAFLLSDSPFTLFMVGQLIAWQAATTSQTKRWILYSLLAGGLAALATLTRPSWLLFTPLGIVCVVLFCQPRRKHLAIGLVMFAGLIAGMTPWWIRNYAVIGHFVPTTLQVGASLYDGLNPDADGGSDMNFVPRIERAVRDGDSLRVRRPNAPPFEYRLDHFMFDESAKWAIQNPGGVLELAAIKFARLWNVWPNEPAFRSWPVRLAIFATYTPILLLAIYGAWHFRQQQFAVLLLTLPAIYSTLLHVVFVASLRYRLPAMLTLSILAAAVISSWALPKTASSAVTRD